MLDSLFLDESVLCFSIWRDTENTTAALFSAKSITVVSEHLKAGRKVVIDMEPFYKTGEPRQYKVITCVGERILPSTTVLCLTVREARALLDDAGIHCDSPQNMQDLQNIGKFVRSLGPILVKKREILGENDDMTTLHYVLCGGRASSNNVSF